MSCRFQAKFIREFLVILVYYDKWNLPFVIYKLTYYYLVLKLAFFIENDFASGSDIHVHVSPSIKI